MVKILLPSSPHYQLLQVTEPGAADDTKLHYESVDMMMKEEVARECMRIGILATIESGADGAIGFNTIPQLKCHSVPKAVEHWSTIKKVGLSPHSTADAKVCDT